ncbi:hypothetical protein GTY80_39860 [Amycolatopsis sp. SID8362]|nr:hypothetical protein [Amycolatopsis sp. SID8362]NBH09383.1 hypothetical protein [Amycolatopsis sp. SID8362]NED46076.1 hypothetical protein [Amycolatopsis sp. SID8362]
MLVALQHTGADRALPPAAEHVVELLRSWGRGPDHLTGLALAGIALPGPRFVDALVFTRTGVVVIAAHEPGPDPGSGERAGAAVAAAKGALSGHEGGRYVTGLVAVVPGAPDWTEPATVPGVAVVLADPRSLRRIIVQHNRWRTVWSADDVLDACYALSLAHLAPPRSALVADGFPARLPARTRLPELPAVVPVPAEPPPAAEELAEPAVPLPRRPGSVVFPRPRPIRQVPWGLLTVLALLVTAGVIAAVFVAQVFHGS